MSKAKTKEDLSKENKELKQQNKKLEGEINQTKTEFTNLSDAFSRVLEEFESLKNQSQPEPEKKEPIIGNINNMEEFEDITPRYRVKTTSLYHGGLNLKGINSDIRFDRFGQTRILNYEDVEAISSNNKAFLEQGLFFVHDDRVLKLIYLDEEKQRRLIEPDVLKSIFELPVSEIKKLYNSTTEALKKEVINTFAEWINKNDPFYLDKNKIEAINEVSGKDVRKIAESIKEYED